jgi:hypothetical protein
MAVRPTPSMPLAASMYALGSSTLTVRTQDFYLRPASTPFRPAILDGLQLAAAGMRLVWQAVGDAKRLRAAMQNGQNRGWASE